VNSNTAGASPAWLNSVITSKALANIRSFLHTRGPRMRSASVISQQGSNIKHVDSEKLEGLSSTLVVVIKIKNRLHLARKATDRARCTSHRSLSQHRSQGGKPGGHISVSKQAWSLRMTHQAGEVMRIARNRRVWIEKTETGFMLGIEAKQRDLAETDPLV
jgi:hypothetical protein